MKTAGWRPRRDNFKPLEGDEEPCVPCVTCKDLGQLAARGSEKR
jgi:hypothetical protein